MVQQLNQSDLNAAKSLLNSSGPAAMYSYLESKGYKYATLANGVAKGDSLAGEAAIGYMKETAEREGHPMSDADVDSVRRDMASGYLDSLQAQADAQGGWLQEILVMMRPGIFILKSFRPMDFPLMRGR